MKNSLIIIITLLVFILILFIIEKLIFSPFKGTDKSWLHHSDYNGRHVTFKSKYNKLSGWFYGENND